MPKFYVTLTRESFVELTIEAEDYDDADMAIQDLIDNTDFEDIQVIDNPRIDIKRHVDDDIEIEINERK